MNSYSTLTRLKWNKIRKSIKSWSIKYILMYKMKNWRIKWKEQQVDWKMDQREKGRGMELIERKKSDLAMQWIAISCEGHSNIAEMTFILFNIIFHSWFNVMNRFFPPNRHFECWSSIEMLVWWFRDWNVILLSFSWTALKDWKSRFNSLPNHHRHYHKVGMTHYFLLCYSVTIFESWFHYLLSLLQSLIHFSPLDHPKPRKNDSWQQ